MPKYRQIGRGVARPYTRGLPKLPSRAMVLVLVAVAAAAACSRLSISRLLRTITRYFAGLELWRPRGGGSFAGRRAVPSPGYQLLDHVALWQAGEVTPWVYHSASLLLHIANAWLVFA